MSAVYTFGTNADEFHVMSDGTFRRGEPFSDLPAIDLPTVSLEEIASDKKVLIEILERASIDWAYYNGWRRWEMGGKNRPV